MHAEGGQMVLHSKHCYFIHRKSKTSRVHDFTPEEWKSEQPCLDTTQFFE